MRNYEPKTVKSGAVLPLGGYELFPGVTGYAVEKNGKIRIPVLDSVERGSGAVGRFLDALSPRCQIVNVISPVLRGMLVKRGWVRQIEYDPAADDNVDVWMPEEAANVNKSTAA